MTLNESKTRWARMLAEGIPGDSPKKLSKVNNPITDGKHKPKPKPKPAASPAVSNATIDVNKPLNIQITDDQVKKRRERIDNYHGD